MRLLLVLVIGALFYFFQNLFFRKNWYKGLDVNVGFEKNMVREGDQNTLIEVVKNDKFLPLPVVLVKFSMTRTFLFPRENNAIVTDQYYRKEYFTCRPNQVITRKYSFIASKRGEYRVSSVDVIYVNNTDERNLLSSFIPLEVIGTRTLSCAYVNPTTSGGIQVKTANLWGSWSSGDTKASFTLHILIA